MDTSSKTFYRQIFALTLPIVVQNLLSAMVSSADVIMLNSVGQAAISSVSLATQYSGVLFMIFFGLGTGITMLSAQYWGKKDLHAIELIQGIALRFALICSVLFFLAAQIIPGPMMTLFTNDPELVELGTDYLRLVSFSYLFWGISEAYLASLRSVERVTVSTLLNTLALALNVGLNAVFIFGLFGAPKLGVAGVALATSISRGIQLAACFLVSMRSSDVKLRFSCMFRHNRILFSDFVHLSLPALGNDLSWSVGFSMYSVILGHLGSDMVAANSIVVVVRNFATVLSFGLASSSTIWLGKLIGQNEMDAAKKDAGRYMKLTVATGILGGLLIFAASPFVLGFADLTPQALQYLKYMLLINTCYVLGIAVNTTLIVGVFRAGGDSRFGFICDTIDMWAYAVPMGFIVAFLLKLPPMVVYLLLCTDEFVKWPWVIRHYRSFQWLKNITKEYE